MCALDTEALARVSGFARFAALQESSTRIVVGVGDESTPEQMVCQTAHGLAERLGGQPAQFPGGHGGFGSHPDGFAARLREVLAPSPA